MSGGLGRVAAAVRWSLHLPEAAAEELLELNRRIQAHRGPWGAWTLLPDGLLRYERVTTLVVELQTFWSEHDLVVGFDWWAWHEGRAWYRSSDPSKYERVDGATARLLLAAVMDPERIDEAMLAALFEAGVVPRILDRLVTLEVRRVRG